MKRLTSLGIILVFAAMVSCYQGHGLSPPGKTQGIQGRVTFVGTWPDTTKEVWVVVLENYPEGITDENELLLFVLENYVNSCLVPLFVDYHDYQLDIPKPGTYAWVLVAWFPDIENYFLGVKELGAYYKGPEQLDTPTPVHITEGIILDGIDIVADLANINRETPFF